jgi:hypothetical protein
MESATVDVATTVANGIRVVKSALRVVRVRDISVDPLYQRGLVPKHKKIAREFNQEALGVPVLAQRADGSLWVVDGQQRIAALKIRGMETVRAEVFASDGPTHEAEVFRLINMNRTKLNSKDEFFALLQAGDEHAKTVMEVAESCGFAITRGGGNTHKSAEFRLTNLTTVGTLMRVAQRGGRDAVQFVLTALVRAWPHDDQRTRKEVIDGLYRFWANNGRDVDMGRLIPRLATTQPARIVYTANAMSGDRCANAAAAIADLYAKRSVPKSAK